MIKVLYLTKYTRMAGSSRLRSFQYFPYLKKQGNDISVHSLFNDAYLKDLYAGKRNLKAVVLALTPQECLQYIQSSKQNKFVSMQ